MPTSPIVFIVAELLMGLFIGGDDGFLYLECEKKKDLNTDMKYYLTFWKTIAR